MVDVYDVRRRCAQAAALADAATQALPRPSQQYHQQVQQQRLHRSTSAPQQYYQHQAPSSRSLPQPSSSQQQQQGAQQPGQSPPQPQYTYQQHQQHRANLLRSNSVTNGSGAGNSSYVNGAFSTPLRADNTFLNMTNTTQSYPLHIKGVPYATTSRLQTLDICLPRPLSESPKDAVWVV